MVRGMYIAGTGMLLQRRNMEIVTNNITNAETTGYKKEILAAHSFDEVMLRRVNDMGIRRGPYVGPLGFGAQVDSNYVDFSDGNLEETGRSTDLALNGDAFFVLQTQAGERYSRSGAFYVNRDGYLTDGEGNYLLGETGRVYVGSDIFSVSQEGIITVGDTVSDRLRLVSFEDNSALRKQGGNLFFTEQQALESADCTVLQGFLENSNVDVGREMVDMITLYRTYETNQRMLTMIDEITGKAVNDIGRLR